MGKNCVEMSSICAKQFEYIRKVGESNMLEIDTIVKICERHNFNELKNWIGEERERYIDSVLNGYKEI